MSNAALLFWADVVLAVHFLIAAFNALSLPVIWIGAAARLTFVRNPWFRWSHVALMGFVLAETLAGRLCPLTEWEATLRRAAGQGGDDGTFVGHWLGRLLFLNLDPVWFIAGYAVFFGLIVLTLFLVPVRRGRKKLPRS